MFDRKKFITLLIPALIEALSITILGIVTAAMVSHVGEYAMSAVSIVNTVNVILMNLFIAIGTGVTVKVSQYIGQAHPNDAKSAAEQGLLLSLLISGGLAVLVVVFSEPLLHLLFGAADELLLTTARSYLVCVALSYPFYSLFSSSVCILRGVGDFKIILFFEILINILNAALCALFIFVFQLGVVGAGLGLVACRAVCGIWMYFILRRGTNLIKIDTIFQRPKKSAILPVLNIGVPAGIDSVIFNGGKLLVQSLLVTMGTAALAADAIANNLAAFLLVPGAAMNMIVVTIVGQCFGTGDLAATRKSIWVLTGYSALFLLVINGICAFFLTPLLSIYNPSPEVFSLAKNLLWLVIPAYPFLWALAFVTPSALRAVGDIRFTTTVSIVSCWVMRVGGSYLFVFEFGLGLYGIWYAMLADWVLRGILFGTRVASHRWERLDRI